MSERSFSKWVSINSPQTRTGETVGVAAGETTERHFRAKRGEVAILKGKNSNLQLVNLWNRLEETNTDRSWCFECQAGRAPITSHYWCQNSFIILHWQFYSCCWHHRAPASSNNIFPDLTWCRHHHQQLRRQHQHHGNEDLGLLVGWTNPNLVWPWIRYSSLQQMMIKLKKQLST